MAAFNFPASPSVNDIYTANGVSYQWNGTLWAVVSAAVREQLTAARTYYVRKDGSDANNGLTNSAGGAFLTIQKAVDVASPLDFGPYQVTISIGAGTWDEMVAASGYVSSGSDLIFSGAAGATTIAPSDGKCFELYGVAASYVFENLILTGNTGIEANKTTVFVAGGVVFGDCETALVSRYSSVIEVVGNISLTGDYEQVLNAYRGGSIVVQNVTVTLTTTPAFSWAFCGVEALGLVAFNGTVFSGAATGARYSVASNAVIDTGGAGATYLPGNAAGTATTGGQYL